MFFRMVLHDGNRGPFLHPHRHIKKDNRGLEDGEADELFDQIFLRNDRPQADQHQDDVDPEVEVWFERFLQKFGHQFLFLLESAFQASTGREVRKNRKHDGHHRERNPNFHSQHTMGPGHLGSICQEDLLKNPVVEKVVTKE